MKANYISFLLVIIGSVLAVRCSNSTPTPLCIPGATQQCLCSLNVQGIQICNQSGHWGECNCIVAADGGADGGSVIDGGASCPNDMVYIPSRHICIDRYEASKGANGLAESKRDKDPWVRITWAAAISACETVSKRLCLPDEWFDACRGPGNTNFPYGNSYYSDACNGREYGELAAVATGSMTACEGGYSGIYDMSGNVWEWVSTCDADGGTCQVRGGAFRNYVEYLTCYGGISYTSSRNSNYTLGFRCCKLLRATADGGLGADGGPQCPSDMVYIPSQHTCIDKYEASKGQSGRAKSVQGVYPWINIPWTDAKYACWAAGKRLCRSDEWKAACRGPQTTTYPYGNTYSSVACNGKDHGIGAAVVAGNMASCEGGYSGLFDMSGNVIEWLGDCRDSLACWVTGGSFSHEANYMSCDDETSYSKVFARNHLGFRCCKSL